jgi:hypothetical protein
MRKPTNRQLLADAEWIMEALLREDCPTAVRDDLRDWLIARDGMNWLDKGLAEALIYDAND